MSLRVQVRGRHGGVNPMNTCDEELRQCLECGTVFEPDVADRDALGNPRCPQCFLMSSRPVAHGDVGDEIVIRTTTPFR